LYSWLEKERAAIFIFFFVYRCNSKWMHALELEKEQKKFKGYLKS